MPAARILVTAAALVTTLGLAGCVPTAPEATPVPTGTATTASPTPTASAAPSADPTSSPTSEPVTIGCSELISLDAMYQYDPNFSLLTSFTPDPGTLAAQAVAEQGVACRWVHNTSGVTIDISVAHLLGSALESARTSAAATGSAPYGYFGNGAAQSFPEPYWLSIVSSTFFEAGDAATLMDDAAAAL